MPACATQELRAAAAAVRAGVCAPRIFAEMAALVAALRQAGRRTLGRQLHQPLGRRRGSAGFRHSRRAHPGRRGARRRRLITSEIVDVPTDEGKAVALKRVGLPAPDAVFGNSIHDLAMLEMARHPFPVNPSPALLEAAAKNGWGYFRPAAAEGWTPRSAANSALSMVSSWPGGFSPTPARRAVASLLFAFTLEAWKTIQQQSRSSACRSRLRFVAAALIVRGGEVLIGQRRPDQPMALQWEFPGGKIEAGESPEQALARELDEELGIRPPSARRSPTSGTTTAMAARWTCSSSRCTSSPARSKTDLSAGALGEARRPARVRFPGRRPRTDPGPGRGQAAVRPKHFESSAGLEASLICLESLREFKVRRYCRATC